MADAVLSNIGLGPVLDGSLFVQGQQLQQRREEAKQQNLTNLQSFAAKQQAEKDKEALAETARQTKLNDLVHKDVSGVKTANEFGQNVLNNMSAEAIKSIGKDIAAGKTDEEVRGGLADTVARMGNYATAVNAGTKTLDDLNVKGSAATPNIDHEGLKNAVLSKWMYETNPDTGKKTLITDPSKLQNIQKIYEDELKNNTSLYVKPGDDPFFKTAKEAGEGVPIGEVKDDPNLSYAGKQRPFETKTYDKAGNVIGTDIDHETDPLLPGVPLATDKVMQMFGGPGTMLPMKVAAENYIKEHSDLNPKDFPPDSPAFNKVMKAQMYQKLKGLFPADFKMIGRAQAQTPEERQAMRHEDSMFNSSLIEQRRIAAQARKDKETETADEFNKTPTAVAIRAANNDAAMLKDMPMKNIGGKSHYDLTASLGDLKFGVNGDGKDIKPIGVYKDADANAGVTVKFQSYEDAKSVMGDMVARNKDEAKKIQPNSIKDGYNVYMPKDVFKKVLKAAAPMNKLAPEDVDKMYDGYKPATTKPVAPAAASIPTHSASDFKSAGWTDGQIQRAVKLGKIKLK